MSPQKEVRIPNLKKELVKALQIDEKKLAGRIKEIGFECKKCAQCCRAEYGDNTVVVFPSEIRDICDKTGLAQDDFVIPAPSQDIDREGNIHTFEWVLKENGDCVFLRNGLCEIYGRRPHICRTYPFYLLDGKLEVSECSGIGRNITDDNSLKLAALLKERLVTEIRESIALIKRFNGFIPRGCGTCVHDSEGEHWLNKVLMTPGK